MSNIAIESLTVNTAHGLTDEQVKQSAVQYGRNVLTPPERDPLWKQFLEKFNDPTIIILLIAAAVSIAMTTLEMFVLHMEEASYVDSIGIFLAVALATLCGFFSELKSAREFELLNKTKDDIPIKVLRNGKIAEVSINDLVVGDIVQLALGDKVPADGTMLYTMNFYIDQSVMTGESMPVEKTANADISDVNDDNSVFRGTMVSDGHGTFVITKVGDNTRYGQIAANLVGSDEDTPLKQKLTVLANYISYVGMTAAGLIFTVMSIFAYFRWTPVWENGTLEAILPLLEGILMAFVIAVTVVVVAVPEGLPMMVSLSLALNMMKMAKENCLIRKLEASETIGSATVICSDKTGTLTQNKMTVTWTFIGGKTSELQSLDSVPVQLIESISINTNSQINIGNPTECAMLRFLADKGADYAQHREKYKRINEVSHNSERKMSSVEVEKDGKSVVFAKGASEKIIPLCKNILADNGNVNPITDYQPQIDEALIYATSQALRVIAVSQDDTLLALIGISDPMRAEVPDAVNVCHSAGVDVKMITGDAKPTAVAIAKTAGILTDDANRQCEEYIWTSEELADIGDDELVEKIPKLKVLARATPMDKLRLVKALHKTGAVVAMTGDGTNDAPALKHADVGISMGITGTEVAKEASKIVLVDDNFKTIVTGIWWGRTLYNNIQKFLQFQLSVNVVALTCAFFGPLFGISLPLTVPQLLWINIIMDTFAALALSTDPPRADSMKRKPIPRDASIITGSMGITILMISLYQIVILFAVLMFGAGLFGIEKPFVLGEDPKNYIESFTVFFTLFVAFQFWNIINCRALHKNENPFSMILKNKLFLMIIGLIGVVQVGLVQISGIFPPVGQIFRVQPLSAREWLIIAGISITIIPFAWVMRMVNRAYD
ncbi:MAG: calcium-translocating P-type ATPase, PMCA-type [Planctomycetaceae bacterium]|nr:calcium-translocating P-type ATPase, PMCA-type [Planctomycetaceae bacterium]